MLIDNYDKKTLKLLKKMRCFDPNYGLSEDDINYLSNSRAVFDKQMFSHDELVKKTIEEYQGITKKQVVNTFLHGLATNNPVDRCALSAYSVAQNFKAHEFYENNEGGAHNCLYCGSLKKFEADLTINNKLRLKGSISSADPNELYFVLKYAPTCFCQKKVRLGEEMLVDFLEFVSAQPKETTPSKMIKAWKKEILPAFKFDMWQKQGLIDTLGFCGLLKPKDKLSYFDEYIDNHKTTRKTHNSDWSYPVDFWVGEDGVNIENLMYWFDEYSIIRQWIKNN